jgi:uncharacterized membrane protein (UPF0127 family)
MRTLAITNTDRGVLVGDKVRLANRWWTRFRGLLGRSTLDAGEGLMLVPCRGVHMFGMRMSLDLAFLDQAGVVTALYHRIEPGARTTIHREAWGVLELPAGVLAETGTAIGDRLDWNGAPPRTKESAQ